MIDQRRLKSFRQPERKSMLDNIIPFAHKILAAHIRNGDTVVDGTAGNGHDTAHLAKLVGENGRVFAFDIQPRALENTFTRLQAAGLTQQVTLLPVGHQFLSDYVPDGITAAIFNFGYLPGGDKSLTTTVSGSLAALNAALNKLSDGGLLCAVLYSGHAEGALETEQIIHWAQQLPQEHYQVLHYQFINRRNHPPCLIVIEKRNHSS